MHRYGALIRVLVTGCGRSGTSLLTVLMKGFHGLRVFDVKEINPRIVSNRSRFKEPFAIKCPQGASRPDQDFYLKTMPDMLWGMRRSSFLTELVETWKTVVCLRDPRDVLTSRHPKAPDRYWVSAERWVKAVERSLVVRNHPNVTFIKYESLVLDPLAELKKLGCALHLEYEDAWVTEFHKETTAEKGIARGLGKVRPIDSASIGRWSDDEHRDRISTVFKNWGDRLGLLMSTLGYDYDAKQLSGPFRSLRASASDAPTC